MAFLQSQSLWCIANRTWAHPTLNAAPVVFNQGELGAWDLKDEICNGQITLCLAQNVHTSIVSAIAATTPPDTVCVWRHFLYIPGL